MLRLTFGLIALVGYTSIFSQSFSNQTNAQGISVPVGATTFGAGVSFFDYNNDGWDDLTIGTRNNGTYLYRNTNGSLTLDQILPNTSEVKSVVWGDFNGDHLPDLFVATYIGQSQLWEQSLCCFTDVAVAAGIPTHPDALTYGAAWADYDRDGDLDLYICNYNQGIGPGNWLMRNNGNDTFTEVAVAAGVDNGIVWSFQPAWADFDHDGWPDLYIINDKLAANTLYRNNGNGTFTDVTVGSGTGIIIDAMSNSIIDFDNDGDLDIYVTNDYGGNRLLRNDGNFIFTDVTAAYGAAVSQFCWGALWIDIENDKDHDLFVCTTDNISNINPLYRMVIGQPLAPGNLLFNTPNNLPAFSAAKGDFNRNGYPDILQGNQGPHNIALWSNQGNANNAFVRISLNATASNTGAVGAWVSVCSGGTCRWQYTHAGHGFLSQDSQHLLFGLHQDNLIDSISVEWPSGFTDRYYNLAPSSSYILTEGETYTFAITASNNGLLCENSNVVLNVNEYPEYLWSTGATASNITVDTSGIYDVTVETIWGFSASATIEIVDALAPEYTLSTTTISCSNASDGSAQVNASPDAFASISWETGETTPEITGLNPGFYSVTLTTSQGCAYHDQIEITEPQALALSFSSNQPNCHNSANGEITLNVSGGVGDYLITPSSFVFGLTAGYYPFTVLDANGCAADSTYFLAAPDALDGMVTAFDATEIGNGSAVIEVSGGTQPYAIVWSNGALGASAENLNPGTYFVTVTDINLCTLTLEVFIDFIAGLSTESIRADFSVFPNPSTTAHWSLRGVNDGSPFWLYGLNGQLVATGQTQNEQVQIATQLAQGSYLLVIQTSEHLFRSMVSIH